ncbi:MAG: histidine phosphatase family protein [Chloroflexi bacterium]|nr:MAG: histidine phosphatase family protein [Chloroflexota bacterium]
MTTFYIIRHAEKEKGDFYNPRLRHQDQPISQKGCLDAEKLYSYFSNKAISAIYVSGYQRTGQTIAFAARQLHIEPTVDERLNEFDIGCIEGMADQEIQEKYPDVLKAYLERTSDFRFPGGETGEEAARRITAYLEEIRRLHAGESIILVSHDGLIRVLACTILGLPVYHRWKFRVDLCGIMEIAAQADGDKWKLIRFNQSCL